MPLPIIANVYRVNMRWSFAAAGQFAQTNMHVLATASNARAVAVAVDAHVTAAMWEMTTSQVGVDTLATTPLDGTSATDIFATGRPAKWSGAQAVGDTHPAQAFIVSQRTAQRGPAKRGRLYLPFVAEAPSSNGVLTVSVATWQAAWDAFLAAMTAAGFLPVVASYKHATDAIITSYLCESVLGTQRRRQGRLRGS